MRVAITEEEQIESEKRSVSSVSKSTIVYYYYYFQVIYDIDIWAIIVASCLQDIPFFLCRLYLIINYKLVTYTTIFFLSKNALIIALQFYRAIVLFNDRYLHPASRRGSSASMLLDARRRPTIVAKETNSPVPSPSREFDPNKSQRRKARKSVPSEPTKEVRASRRASTAANMRNVNIKVRL